MTPPLRPEADAEEVVAAAAEPIRAYDGAADEILEQALAPGADVWDWAPLARAALRRAHGGETDPGRLTVRRRASSR